MQFITTSNFHASPDGVKPFGYNATTMTSPDIKINRTFSRFYTSVENRIERERLRERGRETKRGEREDLQTHTVREMGRKPT